MARFAIIRNGRVHNVVEADDLAAAGAEAVAAGSVGAIGDVWDGANFVTPAPTVLVPEEVSMRQFIDAVIDADLLDTLEAAIAATTPLKARRKLRNLFDRTYVVKRDSLVARGLKQLLGLNNRQMDDLFIAAGAT